MRKLISRVLRPGSFAVLCALLSIPFDGAFAVTLVPGNLVLKTNNTSGQALSQVDVATGVQTGFAQIPNGGQDIVVLPSGGVVHSSEGGVTSIVTGGHRSPPSAPPPAAAPRPPPGLRPPRAGRAPPRRCAAAAHR